MILILLFVVALVVWALQLMKQALVRQEFSLMLAGVLVTSAAAGLVGVYILMNSSLGYLVGGLAYPAVESLGAEQSLAWIGELDNSHTALP
jgi:hypothetical protein